MEKQKGQKCTQQILSLFIFILEMKILKSVLSIL